MRAFILLSTLAALLAGPAAAQNYTREELRLPMAEAGPRGLEALFVRPAEPGRYPLVIISHGAPRKPEERRGMSPNNYYNQALEFARRGFAVALFMRRGYGTSGGDYVEGTKSCADPDYVAAARTSAQDLNAALDTLSKRPDVDTKRIIAVGQSAGGLATTALTAAPPPGLIAAINFAGGRGSRADFEVCNERNLVNAFRTFGKTSRVPMLWVYTENDHFFVPKLAQQFLEAFTAGGGKVTFIAAPAFGEDGHRLFARGIPQWTPYVDKFLADNKLNPRETLAPLPPLPALTPPPQLNARGREAFEKYLRAPGHKAFAVASSGAFGWRTGQRSVDDAKETALRFCGAEKRDCRIVFIDDAAAP